MNLIFATCSEKPNGTLDDGLLKEHLRQRGHQVVFKVWSDSQVEWEKADAVVVRSTWDYHRRLPPFLEWAERVAGLARLYNSREIIEWNSSKRYLLELERHRVPIVPSVFARNARDAQDAAASLLDEHDEIVVKPAVSATAELTFRSGDMTAATAAVSQVLLRGEVLLQPFVESIANDGELSLMFFASGERYGFSHAVLKTPKSGDFRVQSDFGGSVQPQTVSDDLRELASTALSKVPGRALYARVDIIDWKTNPQIGELELIEPDLFFRCAETSVSMIADALESSR
jgi:glutathione synthase/RimK-type ligase-like ATP-grasp enzyme